MHTFLKSKWRILWFALALLMLALVWNLFFQQAETSRRYATRMEKRIIALEDKFQKISQDPTLIQSLAKRGYSLATLESYQSTSLDFNFFISEIKHGRPQLVFWNTQKILPPDITGATVLESTMVTLKNGVYIHMIRYVNLKGHQYVLQGLIPVLEKYFVEIENLRTSFVDFPNALQWVVFSDQPTEFRVHNRSGKLLFYLKNSENNLGTNAPFFNLMLVVALIFLLYFLYIKAQQLTDERGIYRGILFLFTCLLLLRALLFLFPQILMLRQFELFDPSLYSSNFFLNSLGDLFLHVFFYLWFIYFVYRNFQRLQAPLLKEQRSNLLFAILILAYLVVLTFEMAHLIRGLVADGQLSFNVTNFESLSYYSFVAFLVLALMGIGYFLTVWMIMQGVAIWLKDTPYLIYILTAVIGLIVLTFTGNPDFVILNLSVLAWLLVLLLLFQQRYFYIDFVYQNVAVILFWLFVFSISMAAVILTASKVTELSQKKRFAEKLAQQTDPSNERLLSIALTYMDNDFLSPNFNRFKDKALNSQLKDSIINKNFSAYLNQFDTRIYVFEGGITPLGLYNENPISFDTLNTIYQVQGKPTSIDGLHYYEISFDKYAYIWKKEIRTIDNALQGYMFILADPKKYKKDALIPELFRQSRASLLPEYNTQYSYAIYNKGELTEYYNEYSFPTQIKRKEIPKSEFEQRKKDDYEELWYRRSSDQLVIIAQKKSYLIQFITLFAYLFSTFLILLIGLWMTLKIMRTRFRWNEIKKLGQLNLRSQIYGTMILVSVVAVIVIGIVTILFFINRYHRNQKERLSRSMQIMVNQFQHKLVEHALFNDGIEIFEEGVNGEIEKLIKETSEIHGTDINLYDTEGNLKVTSRPLIYNKGVLSTKMNPFAFYQLNIQKTIQYMNEETMGSVQYKSIYHPVRSVDGKVIAYLNIPSYSSEGELKQEISNFIVTMINLNAFIFLLAGAIALLISNKITFTFTLIGQKMRDIHLGKDNQEIVWKQDDEIGVLVKEYNRMVHQLDESAAALAKSEREGAWRQMARQVAHEIKNPLTPMKLSIQYLQKAIDHKSPNIEEMTSKVAHTLVEQIDHLSRIASDFSQFANIGNPKNEVFDFHEVAHTLTTLYGMQDNVAFEWKMVEGSVLLNADKTQLNRLFTNLLKNSLEAAAHQSLIKITVVENLQPNYLLVTVTDNGAGIPESLQTRIFTPNFTTKTSGTGLGLTMSRSIAENAKGKLWFETTIGVGTTFYVQLPLHIVSS